MFIFSCEFIKTLNLHITNLSRNLVRAQYGETLDQASNMITPIIIFVTFCSIIVYISWVYANRVRRKGRLLPPSSSSAKLLTRSMSIGVLHGGKQALQRLIDYHKVRAHNYNPDKNIISNGGVRLRNLVHYMEHPDFWELQSIVTIMEMSGKEAEAAEILKSAVAKARKERRQHEAYEFEMLLVEMFIYMGAYDKALGCQCLRHEEISDARRPLYKAVIHLLLYNCRDRAEKEWEDFKEIRRQLQIPADEINEQEETPVYRAITSFKEFEDIVKLLERDIQEAPYLKIKSSEKL